MTTKYLIQTLSQSLSTHKGHVPASAPCNMLDPMVRWVRTDASSACILLKVCEEIINIKMWASRLLSTLVWHLCRAVGTPIGIVLLKEERIAAIICRGVLNSKKKLSQRDPNQF